MVVTARTSSCPREVRVVARFRASPRICVTTCGTEGRGFERGEPRADRGRPRAGDAEAWPPTVGGLSQATDRLRRLIASDFIALLGVVLDLLR
jgi:hypothetical protein